MSDKIGHEVELIINVDGFKKFYEEYNLGKSKKKVIVLIDDTEKIWDVYKKEFVEIIDSENNIKFICAW